MRECLNCGKLFLARSKKRMKNYRFCCKDCYWEYKIIKDKKANNGKKYNCRV